mgnify:FL=1
MAELIHTNMAKTAKIEKAGKKLTCKRCQNEATIILIDSRFYVFCPTEQRTELLKTY